MSALIKPSLAGALAATLALGACGSDKPEAADDTAYRGGEVVPNIRIDTPGGEARVVTGADITPDLPPGIKLYPGAKVVSVSNVGLEGKRGGAVVSMETGDAPERIVSWYRDAAGSAGYKIDTQLQTGGLTVLSGRADHGGEFSVTATKREGGSSVQLLAGNGAIGE